MFALMLSLQATGSFAMHQSVNSKDRAPRPHIVAGPRGHIVVGPRGRVVVRQAPATYSNAPAVRTTQAAGVQVVPAFRRQQPATIPNAQADKNSHNAAPATAHHQPRIVQPKPIRPNTPQPATVNVFSNMNPADMQAIVDAIHGESDTDIFENMSPEQLVKLSTSDTELERRFPKAQVQPQPAAPQQARARVPQHQAAPRKAAKAQPKPVTPQPAQSTKAVGPARAPKATSVWTEERFDYLTGFFNPTSWLEPVPCAQMWKRSHDIKKFIEQHIATGALLEYINSDTCQAYNELAKTDPANAAPAEKGRIKSAETQQIYEYLLRLLVELKQFNKQLCKCSTKTKDADHFQKMVAEVSNKIKQLEAAINSIETLNHVEQITPDDMAERIKAEKYRHRGPRSKTVDDLIRFLIKRFVAIGTNVGIGVDYGDGQPADITIQAGPYSTTASTNEDADGNKTLQACIDKHGELTEAAETSAQSQVPQASSTADTAAADDASPAPSPTAMTVADKLRLFKDSRKELISLSDLLNKYEKIDKAKQLRSCANLFKQARADLTANDEEVVNTDICISLHPLIQKAKETTEGMQEFSFEMIITATEGAKIVRALHEAGQHQAAELISRKIKTNLEHINENWLDDDDGALYEDPDDDGSQYVDTDSDQSATEPDESDQSAPEPDEDDIAELVIKTDPLVDMIMRGEADNCLEIAGKSSQEQLEILAGSVLGVKDGLVNVIDPRNIVEGTESLIRAGAFVVLQLGRASAWQDAINDGNLELAQKYKTQFDTASEEVARAALEWCEIFAKMDAPGKTRAITAALTTIAAGKPIAALELKIIGAGLSTVSEFAGKAGAALKAKKVAVAVTPEGIGGIVKAAEGAEEAEGAAQGLAAMEETENVAKGGAMPSKGGATPSPTNTLKGKSKYWHPGYVDNLQDSQILLGVQASGKGPSTLGSATSADIWNAGTAWAGANAVPILEDGKVIGYCSADGLKVFRFHLKKKDGIMRANFQEFVQDALKNNAKTEIRNVHVDPIN